MRMKIKLRCLILMVLPLVSSCSNAEQLKSREWLSNNINADENLICQLESGDDLFFASMSDSFGADVVKTGYLIKVANKGERPVAYTAGWKFQDASGNYLERNIAPKMIRSGYIKMNGGMYAEYVELHYLYLKNVDELVVTMELGKATQDDHERKYDAEKIGPCRYKMDGEGVEGVK